MKSSRFIVSLNVALVFLCGVLLGGYGYRAYSLSAAAALNTKQHPRLSPEEFRKRQLDEYTTRLKLTPEQATRLGIILDETRGRFGEVRQKIDPELKTIQNEQIEKVNSILSADQRVEYEKIRKEREERMKKRGGPPRFGPPGI
jgi:hypothetical protein